MTRTLAPTLALVALGLAGLSLGACTDKNAAPEKHNTCYQVVTAKDGSAKFNVVAENKDSIEACASELDAVRMRFMALGSPRTEITGAYNGTFLFIDSGGASTAPALDGGRFVAFSRTDDGRLAVPGAAYQRSPGGDIAITMTRDPLKPHPAATPAKK